jgi:hypothetical protein
MKSQPATHRKCQLVGVRSMRWFAHFIGRKCADKTPLSLNTYGGCPWRVSPALGRFLRWLLARSLSISLIIRVPARRIPGDGKRQKAAGDKSALCPVPFVFIFAVSAFSVPAAFTHPTYSRGSERPELNRSFNMMYPSLLGLTAPELRAPGKSLQSWRDAGFIFLANVL